MSRKTLAYVLIIGGVIVALLSLLADVIRVGMLPGRFGVVQIVGTIVGIAAIAYGIYLLTRREQPAAAPVKAAAQPAPAAPAPAAPAPAAPPVRPDDLTRIEGIGPKIQGILSAAGITTFSALAEATPEKIATLLAEAGFKAPADPTTWPQQAALAAKGDWAALEELQNTLKAGRG